MRYTDTELTKIQKQMKKEGVKRYQDLDVYQQEVIKRGGHAKNSHLLIPVLGENKTRVE